MKKGFSLIELIIAMSIMTIIAAVVVISANSFLPSLRLTNSAKAVVTSLREAQEETVTTQFRHGVRFDYNINPIKLVIFKVDGATDIKTFELPKDVTMSFDQAIIDKGYKVTFSADGGPDVGGNITVTYMGASKIINISTAGVIKIASSASTPAPASPLPASPSPTQTSTSGPVTYKDIATADLFVVGTGNNDVRMFLSVPSGKTSDGVCKDKLISATLNVYESAFLGSFGRMTVPVFYKYFIDIDENSQAAFLNEIPLEDSGQMFVLYDTDNPSWISIDVTEILRNALDPHMVFAFAPSGALQFGNTVLKGDTEVPPFPAGYVFIGNQIDAETFSGAGFTSLHNGDSAHHPYVELICNP